MTPRIWQNNQTYTIQTSSGHIWQLIKLKIGFTEKDCGTGNENYKGCGTLLKKIPQELRKAFFEKQKL